MTKKKENCHYELLCLLNDKNKNQDKYGKMINQMESLLGKENIEKIEEKNWKPIYKIRKLEEGNYLLIYFHSERKKVKQLEKEVLQSLPKSFLNRYLLINQENEKSNKIKLIKKNAQQS